MKKYFLCMLIIATFLLTPVLAKAESSAKITSSSSNNELASEKTEILAQTTKYLKNVTVYDTSEYQTYALRSNSEPLRAISNETVEVSEEEYLSIDPKTFQSVSVNAYTTVETTYLLLTTSIGDYDGQSFNYVDTFSYKIIPSVRSYDIIGIGYNDNVKPVDGTMSCVLYYGVSTESKSFKSNWLKTTANGSSCILNLPDGSDVSNISVIFDFRVQKVNPNETIESQLAVGDYRHATEVVSLFIASTNEVNETTGITFPLKYEGMYNINPLADARYKVAW